MNLYGCQETIVSEMKDLQKTEATSHGGTCQRSSVAQGWA